MEQIRESRFTDINACSGADDVRRMSPLERGSWVEAARQKLATTEDMSELSWVEKLSLTAASYGFWLRHLGNPGFTENHEWPQLAKLVADLTEEGKRALKDDLALHVKVLGALSLDIGYIEMQNRLHDRSYELLMSNPDIVDTLEKWSTVSASHFVNAHDGLLRLGTTVSTDGRSVMSAQARKLLDDAGVTHAAVLRVMQAASDAAAQAWTEEAARAGIHDVARPIRVLAAEPAEYLTQFNVMRDETGGSYYKITEMAAEMLDPRTSLHIAFHEPHHALQGRLSVLHEKGEILPPPMKRAREAFDLLKDFGGRNCQPNVFEPAGPEARDLAFTAYRTCLHEESAFYQGNRAAIETNRRFMPGVSPKTTTLLKESPALEKFLPVDDLNWLRERGAKSNRPATGSMPCPDKPSR